LNTPNKLTVSRMLITPVFLAAFLIDIPHRFLIALVVFSIAAVTDAIDGKLARKNNEITVFGKLLDPVADKMLTTAALLAFLSIGWCNVWIVMIILSREFAITSIRLIASSQGVVIPANIWGKLKTVSQMTFTIVIMLLGELDEVFGIFNQATRITMPFVSNILLWITAVFTVISGTIYIAQSRKLIDFTK
jgi:CDP-diacylglycerol---glycerol-3-phosphate 3-phosphatidyltransferase